MLGMSFDKASPQTNETSGLYLDRIYIKLHHENTLQEMTCIREQADNNPLRCGKVI